MTQDPRPLVIENGTVVMPDGLVEEGRIVCEADRIAAVGKRCGGRVAARVARQPETGRTMVAEVLLTGLSLHMRTTYSGSWAVRRKVR